MKRIFISHASKDKFIVDAFIDLILQNGLGLTVADIFSTSSDGMRITSGTDWREAIKENLTSAKVTFLLVSPNYKESEVCLNEMGAAWLTNATVLPMIIEPINYSSVGVIQQPVQVEKLLDSSSLDRIKDILQEKLEIPAEQIKSDRWTTKKVEFISKCKTQIKDNPFPEPISRIDFEELSKNNSELDKTINSLINEKQELESLNQDLMKLKDAEQVQEVLNDHSDSSIYEEFEQLRKNVRDNLKQFDPAVITAFFNSISGKEIELGWSLYKKELEYAIANDYISDEGNADFDSTYEMRELKASIDKLREFMESERAGEIIETVEKEHRVTFSLGNQGFWEGVFNTSIYY